MIKIDHNPGTIILTDIDSFFMSKYSISAYSQKDDNICVHVTTPQYFLDGLGKLPAGPILLDDAQINAYNPREKTFKLTRQILINAHAHCQKHAIIINSNRQGMLRDIDILKMLAHRKRLAIIMPIMPETNLNKTLKTMHTLKKHGILIGALTPDANKLNTPKVLSLFSAIKSAGADFIVPDVANYTDNNAHLYQCLKTLNLPPRMPMKYWHDWFNLSDSIYLAISHLQVLLSSNHSRYTKLKAFKQAYHHLNILQPDDHTAAKWLQLKLSDDAFDPQIKHYLKPLLNHQIYDYTTLSWLPPLDDIK